MLTSRSSTEDQTAGFFEARSNEFIGKPFQEIELLARFRAGAESMALHLELEKQRKINEKLALTDSLTELVNRRALMQTLRVDEDRCRRSRTPLGIVMADVDKFKSINDEYGHNTGDKILKVVAKCMQACVRSGDHVGRWGGEEFLMVLPNTDIIQAAEIAERCRASLAAQEIVAEDGRPLRVSSSFGVSSADGLDRQDVMDLVNEADKALYWAKNAGRNRVKIYVASADPERRKSAG
jgi:diguanylate cyclase (GGDEF)-like protein